MRQEFEVHLEPLLSVPVERELPLRQRLWQQGWLRKGLILIVLAVLWEAVARYQNNDLLLPHFIFYMTLQLRKTLAHAIPRTFT